MVAAEVFLLSPAWLKRFLQKSVIAARRPATVQQVAFGHRRERAGRCVARGLEGNFNFAANAARFRISVD